MEKPKKNWLRQIAAWVVDMVCVIAAVGLGAAWKDRMAHPMAGFVCSVLILAVLVFGSIIGNALFEKRMKSASVQSIQDLFDRRRERMQADEAREKRRLDQLCRLAVGYVLALAASGLSVCFFASAALDVGGCVSVSVPCMFLMYGLVSRLFRRKEKPDLSKALPEKDYPRLYALARRASGTDLPIHIFLSQPSPEEECNAGVVHMDGRVHLLLGPMLLCVATETELLQVIRHEFAHVDLAHTRQTVSFERLMGYLNGGQDIFDLGADLALGLPTNLLALEGQYYFALSNAAKERSADARAAGEGDCFAQASVLAKLHAHSLFLYEQEPYTNLYRSESMPTDFTTARIRHFRQQLVSREEDWRRMMERELPSRVASHPTFRQRWEDLGFCGYSLTPAAEEGDHARECWAAAAESDRAMSQMSQERYAELRQENYLSFLETVSQWEADGVLRSPEEMRPVVMAYYRLGMPERAEELCDRLMAENDSVFATAFARYWKGCLLLYRYDSAGLELIYQAMETNFNYIEEGLDMIGSFCTMMGLEQELEEYRSRAVEYMQFRRDHSATGIHPRADLSPEQLPQRWQERIMEHILKNAGGAIYQVYLVHETVDENYGPSSFVLRYREGTGEEEQLRIYDSVFRLLDDWPENWDFCLYDYEPAMERVLKKIPGACIYDVGEG